MSAEASRQVEIVNIKGLHARASRKFAEMATTFQSKIVVRREGDPTTAAGTSLMDLMMLGAGIGSTIYLSAEGPDAEAALDALCGLVSSRFGESE